MRKIAANIPSFSNGVKKGLAEGIDRELIISTPVDIGTARSNWVISLGAENTDFILAYAPGSHLGIAEKTNAFAAIIQGRHEIAGALPGQTIFLCNNAPYIGILNDGHSKQAPPLFIESAITRGITTLNNVSFTA